MRRLILPVVALALLGFSLVPAGANHAWADYHWARVSNPFTIKLNSSLAPSATADWSSYLSTTSSDWSASSVLNTTIQSSANDSNTRRKCPPISGQDRVCNQTYGFNGWLGIASIWVDANHHITQGTTKMNDSYFNTSTYNKPEWRNLVMCQEVGHTFGLTHQDENFNNANLGTCMDYTNYPLGPPDNEHPNQHDYDELVTIYSHTDSYNTNSLALSLQSAYVQVSTDGAYLVYTWILPADPNVTIQGIAGLLG